MALSASEKVCRFYAQGACARGEILNPGLEERHLCARLAKWMREWDDFLDRADSFGLSEDLASRIWNARKYKLAAAPELCPPESFCGISAGKHPPDTPAQCRHMRQGACLLTMPRCRGICEHYARPAEIE